MKQLLTYTFLLCSFVSAANADLTVAVKDLEPRGITEQEVLTLSDVLRSELHTMDSVRVMERGEMQEILREQAFQQSGACNDKSCVVEMGQLLGIKQMIAGSIGKVGKAYSISLRMISVETGQIVRSVSHTYTGPIEGLLSGEMRIVAHKLFGIEPKIPDRTRASSKGIRRVVGFGLAGAAVIGGGIAGFLLLREEDAEPATTSLEVRW